MFRPKGFTVFILCFVSQYCFAQYDGVNGESTESNPTVEQRKKRTDPADTLIDDYEDRPSILDNTDLYKAIEFNTNGNQNLLYLAFDPQAGVALNDQFFLGGGVNLGLFNAYGMGGFFGFSRIVVNKIFLQAEYRTINTYLIQENQRGWVSSPIFMVGYAYDDDMSSWGSIGISVNGNFSRNMPFGALVYRIGVRF